MTFDASAAWRRQVVAFSAMSLVASLDPPHAGKKYETGEHRNEERTCQCSAGSTNSLGLLPLFCKVYCCLRQHPVLVYAHLLLGPRECGQENGPTIGYSVPNQNEGQNWGSWTPTLMTVITSSQPSLTVLNCFLKQFLTKSTSPQNWGSPCSL
eukprot:6092875-Amphidinium_carterae.1